jgi:hypothetical protein
MKEKEKLETCVDGFSKEMKEKLVEKYEEGFEGWETMPRDEILMRIHYHAGRLLLGYNEEVDVANFCMFLWRQHRK